MKQFFLLAGLVISCSFGFSQTITDSSTLRSRINADIVTNNTKAITAVKLNQILNGYLNIWPKTKLDSITRTKIGCQSIQKYWINGTPYIFDTVYTPNGIIDSGLVTRISDTVYSISLTR